MPLKSSRYHLATLACAKCAGNSRFRPPSDVIIRRIIFSCRIVAVLPIAVLRFVECELKRDVGVIVGDDEFCVVEKVIHDLLVCPGAILVEEGKRGVPVEQRDGWRDTLLDHLTNNAIIMSHRLTIHGALSEWKNSRPADARTEAGNPKGTSSVQNLACSNSSVRRLHRRCYYPQPRLALGAQVDPRLMVLCLQRLQPLRSDTPRRAPPSGNLSGAWRRRGLCRRLGLEGGIFQGVDMS